MILVVNKRTYTGQGEFIGRPSILGNPYSHLEKSKAEYRVDSRQEAIECYETWFDAQLINSPVKQEFNRLVRIYKEKGELVLICYCAPYSCHGHFLSRRIEKEANDV
jgi:hypothetical protein